MTAVAAGEGPPEALRGLGAAIEEVSLSLEEAFLACLGDRGERTLLAGGPEDSLIAEVTA